MPIRFRPLLSDPDRPQYSINWRMVRLSLTTRDGWAYLVQLVLLFGAIGLIALNALAWWKTGNVLAGLTALWLYLVVTWPIMRSWIRFGRDPW